MIGSLRICFPTEKFLTFLKRGNIKFNEKKTSIHSIHINEYEMGSYKGILGLTGTFKVNNKIYFI